MPQPKMVVASDVERAVRKSDAIGTAVGTVAAIATLLLLPTAYRGLPVAIALGLSAGLVGFVISRALKKGA